MNFKLPYFDLNLNGLKVSPYNETDLTSIQRDVKIDPILSSIKSLGFFNFPHNISNEELLRMTDKARSLREKYDGAIVIGIGGSYLGPLTILETLRTPEERLNFPIHFISNTDADAILRAEYFIKKHKCLTIVISKSGNTIESLSAFFHLSHHLDQEGFVMITDPKHGELKRLATLEGWTSFEIPTSIGGRFSVLTAVGLFPAAIAGLSPIALIEGAREMKEHLLKTNGEPAFILSTLKYIWDTQYRHTIQYLMAYHSGLRFMADWYVQLFAESLGKKMLNHHSTGPTPVASVGTSDQHSLLQLFKEGPLNKIIGFLSTRPSKETPYKKPKFKMNDFDFLENKSFEEMTYLASVATEKSLTNSNVPTYRIDLERLREHALGSLFFFLETTCAISGHLYKVNAFDQPGVEESKRLLREYLCLERNKLPI